MSGRDPIQALMKRAGLNSKKTFAPTNHPEKATFAAEKFNRVAELLESGDVTSAGVAASQAQALLEVLQALGKQDQVEELRDPKCDAKQDAQRKWDALIEPNEREAHRLATHYREHPFNFFSTMAPYKAPPPPPKEPRDGTRYLAVLEATDPAVAEKLGLPARFEFKHGVGRRGFSLSLYDAINRKMKPGAPRADGWSLSAMWRPRSENDPTSYWTSIRAVKHESGKRGGFRTHEVNYHLIHSTHPRGVEKLEERDGKPTKAKRKAKA